MIVPPRQSGFTLVELMVVIVLMGLMASAVVLSVSTIGGGPQAEAERFAGRLVAARNEAILTGQPMAVWIAPSGYGFERRGENGWQAVEIAPFDGHDWQGVSLAQAGDAGARQRLRFDAMGLPEGPFEMALDADGKRARVVIDSAGEVDVQ